MVHPVAEVKDYTNAGALRHTLNVELLNIRAKHLLNGSGNFSFAIYTKTGDQYKFYDIAEHDRIKIYLGYDAVGATPVLQGRVSRVTAPLKIENGYIRIVEGKDQSEILDRRIIDQMAYLSTSGSTIALALATDLGLATGSIDLGAADESQIFENETYMDALTKISDYWISAGSQIQKDFYVNDDDSPALIWKARPIRTAGVEALTIGTNIISCSVLRDILGSKNRVKVFGAFDEETVVARQTAKTPNAEQWTEPATTPPPNWTCNIGTLTRSAVAHTGSYSIAVASAVVGGMDVADFEHNLAPDLKFFSGLPQTGTYSFGAIHFEVNNSATIPFTTGEIRLKAPDNANYYYKTFSSIFSPPTPNWTENNIALADNSVAWSEVGSPNWKYIESLWFMVRINPMGAGFTVYIDELDLRGGRFWNQTSDATSITAYDQRDATYIYDNLKTNAECQSRSEVLLYQQKDQAIRVDMQVLGNTNLLIGDRIPLTIPAENITTTNFDVLSAEHVWDKNEGFTTNLSMLNAGNSRNTPSVTFGEFMERRLKGLREVSRGDRITR